MPRSPFTIEEILAWADSHRARTGKWPTALSGPVYEALDETWLNINQAMCAGMRGFTRRQTTLARLLAQHRGKRNQGQLPDLTIPQILSWADEHHQRTGKWPNYRSGPIPGTDETWATIHMALCRGRRGLAKSTLAALLAAEGRTIRDSRKPATPTLEQILGWADAHYKRFGNWPSTTSRMIADAENRTWGSVDSRLRETGLTLSKLLRRERGLAPYHGKPRLTIRQILIWADEHHSRTGRWPSRAAGKVQPAPNESWWQIDRALAKGKRGLKGGSSLAKLFAKRRGRSPRETPPPLTVEQIRVWAQAYKAKHGCWPDRKSGDIEGARGETWLAVWIAMYQGSRGLKRRIEVSEVFRE